MKKKKKAAKKTLKKKKPGIRLKSLPDFEDEPRDLDEIDADGAAEDRPIDDVDEIPHKEEE